MLQLLLAVQVLNLSTQGFLRSIGHTFRKVPYETGYRKPKIETLIKLADFYNVSIDYLVGRSDKQK